MSSLLIVIPLIALLLLNLPLGSWLRKVSVWAVLLLVAAEAFSAIFLPSCVWSGACEWVMPFFSFSLTVDPLAVVMLVSISVVTFSALLVGWYSIKDLTRKFDFVNLVLMSLIGMNGIVLVNDLFSLYVFLEIVAVSSFILIALHKDKDALEGSFKYLVLSAVATVFMLSSIALLMMVTGETSFAAVAASLKASPANPLAVVAAALFVGGLCIKGGLVPFHGWLPDAYSSAPAGASVLLAGIITKTTGIYTMVRLITAVFGYSEPIREILLAAGAVSILVGALAALGQKDIKRMLAFSSISQVGYIVVSLGAGTPLGIAGAVFHLFNHSIFKSQLFVNAAAVEEQAGTRDMDRLGGLAQRMPFTGATSIVAFLSTAGIPPLSGFWSKLIIIMALWQSGHSYYAALAILASIITLAYFLSMQRRVFFGKVREGLEHIKEAHPGIVIPAVILALITIGAGIFFPYVLTAFILPVQSIIG